MNAVIDLVGKRFGRLTVVSRNDHRGGLARWNCRCDCGKDKVVRSGNLISGNTTSCRCSHIKHGDTIGRKRSPEFICWHNMISRCRNPKCKGYKDYGGRGIIVCERWHVFENFLADMGRRPSPNLTIEREDNEKGYFPENCVWATRSAQNKNRRPRKLKHSEVLEIYQRVTSGETQRSIAADYDIYQRTVSYIKTGQFWGWLTGAPQKKAVEKLRAMGKP